MITKTKIDWADFTWNPVWGCLEGCEFCYARKISARFGERYGCKDFTPTWIESNYLKQFPWKPSRIFVGSMSDIYYWDHTWINKVIHKIKLYPQHTFMFLTKHPEIYNKISGYDFPKNCWLGTSITKFEDRWRAEELFVTRQKNISFVSLEPMLDDIISDFVNLHNWIIVGLETGRKNVFLPGIKTIERLVYTCKRLSVPLFMKSSMSKVWDGKLIQEFPIE